MQLITSKAWLPTRECSRPWRRAAVWLATLGPFFFASYGFANWVSSQRTNVPSFVFEWERSIPFLAWTIVPYCSIDPLYAVSLFICTSRSELTVHGLRLLTAQLLSVFVFLLFPLRLSLVRPATEGLFGQLFQLLSGFDQPFNEAPSLHLSLAVILWARYSAHLRGVWLWPMRAWLVLVGVSTLTTYQHQFVDLPSGIAVGALVLVLLPEQPVSADAQRRRLSAVYLTASLLLSAFAIRFGGAAWALLWPATALLTVSGIYWKGAAGGFRKHNGRIDLAMRLLMSPYLWAARLNSIWWTRRDGPQEIAEGVWIGGMPHGSERSAPAIRSIVDLTAELPFHGATTEYRGVPMLDLLVPSTDQIEAAVDAIDGLAANRPTLICCALGYSRSATVAAAWLVASGTSASIDAAIARLSAVRPRIRLSPAHRQRLAEWVEQRVS